MRINARLGPDDSRKLELLRERTKVGTTEILRRGIGAYFEQVQRQGRAPGAILEAAGFVGCAEGPGELSANYKTELTKGFSAKHGHR